MPLKLALGVRETVAGHRLGALEGMGGGGGSPPSNASLGGGGGPSPPSRDQRDHRGKKRNSIAFGKSTSQRIYPCCRLQKTSFRILVGIYCHNIPTHTPQSG